MLAKYPTIQNSILNCGRMDFAGV